MDNCRFRHALRRRDDVGGGLYMRELFGRGIKNPGCWEAAGRISREGGVSVGWGFVLGSRRGPWRIGSRCRRGIRVGRVLGECRG